ncbi:MAG: hypothetical protein KTR31_12750 [Myxococcales bacterium]|nr:hypothetical protein [Myxococcales bacterium]
MRRVWMTLALALGLGAAEVAQATPGHAGLAHIGASSVEEGSRWVGGGLGAGLFVYTGVAGGVVETGRALGRRGALHAHLGTALNSFGDTPMVFGTLSARHLLVDTEGVRFAVTGQWLSYAYPASNGLLWENKISPGIALDAGGRVARFDLSLPVWGVISVNQFVGPARFPVPQAFTTGVSFRGNERHRFRIGFPDGFSWHYTSRKGAYVDVGGVPFIIGSLWVKFGHTL